MRTEFEKVIIPEKIQTKAVFIAEDGTKFYSQKECEMYECSLKINNHPVFKDSKDIYTYPEWHRAKAYYFSSEDDYIFFLKSQGLNEDDYFFESDYEVFGNGWYIFWEEEFENSHNEYSLMSLNNYITKATEDFRTWKDEILLKVFSKDDQ